MIVRINLFVASILSFFFFSFNDAFSQQRGLPRDTIAGIMFYNVENLFDVVNDPNTLDDEFTPQGARRWTRKRLHEKYSNISRVILTAGGWNLPVIVGLCEVENNWVLNGLLSETGLYNLNYRFVHYDSPDFRGIDVAMLYRRDRFLVVESKPIVVDYGEKERPTRDVLYVKGVLDKTDTLHILVNHWSSRLGGAAQSQWKRQFAANIVSNFADSLRQANSNSHVIIMGDFNEPARSDVFIKDMGVGKPGGDSWLVSSALELPTGVGTLKHQQAWEVFDQIIVSSSFYRDNSEIKISPEPMRIVDLPFLLERDNAFGGTRPFRTYLGFKYHGGYSDHLPVWIDLIVKHP